MDGYEFVTLTIPGSRNTPDRLLWIRESAVQAVEEKDIHSGAVHSIVYLANGVTFAVAETARDIFEEEPAPDA